VGSPTLAYVSVSCGVSVASRHHKVWTHRIVGDLGIVAKSTDFDQPVNWLGPDRFLLGVCAIKSGDIPDRGERRSANLIFGQRRVVRDGEEASNAHLVGGEGTWGSALLPGFIHAPVLSEQMTLVQPRVSTLGRFRTIAPLLAIFFVPNARHAVITAARPSGIAATARATAILR
jgi:hypothetical protein